MGRRTLRLERSPDGLDIVSHGRRGPGDRAFSGGARDRAGARGHFDYTDCHGRLPIETDEGVELAGRDAGEQLMEDWNLALSRGQYLAGHLARHRGVVAQALRQHRPAQRAVGRRSRKSSSKASALGSCRHRSSFAGRELELTGARCVHSIAGPDGVAPAMPVPYKLRCFDADFSAAKACKCPGRGRDCCAQCSAASCSRLLSSRSPASVLGPLTDPCTANSLCSPEGVTGRVQSSPLWIRCIR